VHPRGRTLEPPQLSGLDLLEEVAHDLRSPLNAILLLAEEVASGRDGAINTVQRKRLRLMYGAALHLMSVTNDVLELGAGGTQLLERAPVPLSVIDILEAVRDIVQPQAEEKDLPVHLWPLRQHQRLGHPVALSRILLNLTINALKFTEKGFVSLSAEERGPSRVEFAVRDTGPGISAAGLDTLYQTVRRARGRDGYAFSSTGLGLATCRRLVEAMQSELHVETRRGWGTRFYFEVTLPRLRLRRRTD